MRPGLAAAAILSCFLIASLVVVPVSSGKPVVPSTPPNIDISQRHTNE